MPPYPLPVLRIARLAVSDADQGRGLGGALLRFCIELAEQLRDEVGCVGIVVDAKPKSTALYSRYGFVDVDAVEGAAAFIPRAVLIFLPLLTVPVKRCQEH